MTDNTDGKNPPENKVVDFSKFKKNKVEGTTTSFPQHTPVDSSPATPNQPDDTEERWIVIDLNDGSSVKARGYIGLTSSFIAVGDRAGQIRFAVNSPYWTVVADVTGDEEYKEDFGAEEG